MKTIILFAAMLLTIGCSGSSKLYVGDRTITVVNSGVTTTTKDNNYAIDVQQTARGGLLIEGLTEWGPVHFDRMMGQPDAYTLGYAPKLNYSNNTGARETFKFSGDFTSGESNCSAGLCSIEIKGRAEWNNLEKGTIEVKDVTWNFSGLAY